MMKLVTRIKTKHSCVQEYAVAASYFPVCLLNLQNLNRFFSCPCRRGLIKIEGGARSTLRWQPLLSSPSSPTPLLSSQVLVSFLWWTRRKRCPSLKLEIRSVDERTNILCSQRLMVNSLDRVSMAHLARCRDQLHCPRGSACVPHEDPVLADSKWPE